MKILSVDDLSSLPPVETLADTHLIARGFNLVFGPSGAYKSFYMLHQALVIARSSLVIYVAAEGSGGLARRIKAWREYYGGDYGQLYFLCQEVNLLDLPSVNEFIAAVKKLGQHPELIIFDTYARCMIGGDENSAKDTGRVIQHCAIIQRQLNTAIGLVHHSNRAERGERGSGALRGACDSIIEMNDSDGLIKVSCSKAKDSPDWEPELYRFYPVAESGVLLPPEFVEASDNLTLMDLDVLQFLALEVFLSAGASAKQVSEGLNISIRTLYRVLSKLKRLCHIQQDSKGDPYKLLAQGKAALCQLTTKQDVNGKVIPIKKIH